MAAGKMEANHGDSNKHGVSEEDARKESSKVAKQASEAQKKATELMGAAAAAGDPEERQKLMEEALEQQIQSKSLGKTAKYLRSGTFQGMAIGAGLGIAPGASLGTISGALVGGVTSTALGGLGAGIGAATGALHGPFWDMSKGASKGIQKITGNIPGWKATESQKKQLEKMVGQINEQDAPGNDELESWTNEGASEDQKEAMEKAKAALPSIPSAGGSKDSEKTGKSENEESQAQEQHAEESPKGKDAEESDSKKKTSESEGNQKNEEEPVTGGKVDPAQDQPQGAQSNYRDAAIQTEEEGRKKPRKLQVKSESDSTQSRQPSGTRKQPRKLETRSA